MKKFILLLIVISATALTAQDYQYFTAKQGIPKAMEIAKVYFQSDSVELYEIKCILTGEDSAGNEISIEPINPYNDTNGTSLYWYYKSCSQIDSCYYFRVKKQNDIYFVDSIFYGYLKHRFYNPINSNDIIIDSDSLLNCIDYCYHYDINQIIKQRRQYFHLVFSEANHFECPEWFYIGKGAYSCEISTKTGDCWDLLMSVPPIENEFTGYIFTSYPNTDNIIIELNSEMIYYAELRLFDQVGVLLFADKLNNKSYELSTYNYPSGMYLLQIKYGGNILTKTVMVVH